MKSYMVEIFPAVLAIILLGLSLVALIVLFETVRWRWQIARAGNRMAVPPPQDRIEDGRSAPREHGESEGLRAPSVAAGEDDDLFAPDQTETEQNPVSDTDSITLPQDFFPGPVTQQTSVDGDADEGRVAPGQDNKQRRRARKADKRGPADSSAANDMPWRRNQGERQTEVSPREVDRVRRRAKKEQEPDEARASRRQSRMARKGE